MRIVRFNLINENEPEADKNGHSFTYDLELVLGGKLNGVPRHELQYTTAFEEGMTGDSRRQRKRKPTQVMEEATSSGTTGKGASTAKKKKKAPANSKSSAKTSGSKTATTKGGNNKKRGSKASGSTAGKKKSKATSETAKVTIVNTTNTGNGLGMFERHRREFERCLLRLQKLDVYNFFNEQDVPPEHDECYETKATPPSEENTNSTFGGMEKNMSISAMEATSSSIEPDKAPSSSSSSSSTTTENDSDKNTDSVKFPNHPPYNFVVLRKRLEEGRYLLDRQRISDAEENFHSDGTKIKVEDGKPRRSTSISMAHPVGIHWDLFRDDILGMCSSAMERNDDDDGTPGTLSNTAEKIKTAMEQIYEKTGRKQSKEMDQSNDAHRFTKILEGAENKEAAMQGKSWRRKGESIYCELHRVVGEKME